MSEAIEEVEENKFTVTQIQNNLVAVLENINNHNYVKVNLIKNCSYVGFIHSVDPVTNSIILSVPQGDAYKTVLIPGHAVVDISFQERPANIVLPPKKEIAPESKQDILKRKARLISWFKTNLLPVTELDNKIVIGNVTLLEPYRISDLCTDNPIVAMRIKNVIEKMPEDFESK
ncbi:hypothetical protein PYW07_017257 [Mythimna separata]|uniref:AD domain-containing protein n=1 Tax=Mythimna separata TaxID=271217 RepID=A0AAD8DYC9_MYTSE|nr:hypothetical protein PYW07_017257 [Mythimna separata]